MLQYVAVHGRVLTFRLAVKKLGHPARKKKIKFKKVKRNKPQTMKFSIEKMGNREIAAE